MDKVRQLLASFLLYLEAGQRATAEAYLIAFRNSIREDEARQVELDAVAWLEARR